MPYPIQNVNAFSEAELWYIYQQLVEINTNTSGGGGGGLSQTELYEVFNGTNSQGLAVSLFESLSGGDTPLANLLVETISGNNFSLANVNWNIYGQLTTSNSSLASIDTNTNQISNHTGSIRTPVIISATGSGTIAVQIHNISIANVGGAVGTITVDGTTVNLPVGAVINYDAGGNNNRFAINKFSYNGTGTTLLIQYVA